jgi:hypothetical protein
MNPPVDDHDDEESDNDTCSDVDTISSDCEEEDDDESVGSVGYHCQIDECNETDSFSGDKVQLSIRERMQLSEAARYENECDDFSPKDVDRMMQEFVSTSCAWSC